MSAVLKHYRKDLWLRKPLGRDFTMAKLVKWIENELPALGGIVSKEYAQRDYDVVMDKFVALMVDFVGFTIRKDRSVSQQLLAARVDEVQAENLGKGELLWLEDPVGSAPSNGPIQTRYEALEGGEKQQFDWLQALTQDFVLYNVDHIVSEEYTSMIRRALKKARVDSGDQKATLVWTDVRKMMRAPLKDRDEGEVAKTLP